MDSFTYCNPLGEDTPNPPVELLRDVIFHQPPDYFIVGSGACLLYNVRYLSSGTVSLHDEPWLEFFYHEPYGFFFRYYSPQGPNLVPYDGSPCEQLVEHYYGGEPMRVPTSCFVPREVAWEIIQEFCRSRKCSSVASWVPLDTLKFDRGPAPAGRDLEDDDDGFIQTPSHPFRISWEDCKQSGWRAFCHEEKYPQDFEHSREMDCYQRSYVSVWVGTFPDENSFKMYLGEPDWWIWEYEESYELSPFWTDLEIWWINLGYLNGSLWTRYSGNQLPIDQLLLGSPQYDSFCDEFMQRARILGVMAGNAAICIYDLDYDERGVFAFGYLRFVGSFRFRGVQG